METQCPRCHNRMYRNADDDLACMMCGEVVYNQPQPYAITASVIEKIHEPRPGRGRQLGVRERSPRKPRKRIVLPRTTLGAALRAITDDVRATNWKIVWSE